MSKLKIGLYVGVDSLGGVVTNNGKIVSFSRYDLASLEEESHVENLSDDVKWEALINKAMRDMNVEAKDVRLSLADRDFIFRFFEMPFMKQSEVQSSLTYEIEKYIPFKLEDLRWDYSYASFPKEKKIDVSFIGIKEDIYQNIQGLFTRLGFNPLSFEPSAVSLARGIKTLKKFSKIKNFALLELTSGEGYLTFFYCDLPVFNRYFNLVRVDGELKTEDVVNPVRLSFQYFEREFHFYKLEHLIVASNSPDDTLVSMLKEDLQCNVHLCCPDDVMPGGGSLESLKALGAADLSASMYKFRPVLRPTFEQLARVKKEIPLNRTMLLSLLAIGLVVYTGIYFWTENNVKQLQGVLQNKMMEVVMPEAIKPVGWDGAQNMIDGKRDELKTISGIKSAYHPITPFLQKMIRTKDESFIQEGIWLESFDLHDNAGMWQGSLSGKAFFDDERKERTAIDEFVYKFRQDSVLRGYFPQVELVSASCIVDGEFNLMDFKVELR